MALSPQSPSEQARWFAEEIQPHEPSLRSYLRAHFPLLPDVDDVVQESYARLIRARAAGRIAHARAFLFTTARNAALDFFRRRKIVSFEPVGDLSVLSVISDEPDAAETVNRRQELELLAQAIRELPDRCREVLTLRLVYGRSHKEIGADLGISEFTVRAHLARGMQRCARFFEARGMLKASAPSPFSTP